MGPGKDRTGRHPKKGRKRRQAPNKVLENARVEIPLFPFSIVQFSFEPFSPIFTEEMNKRMRMKWTEMSTVYAGPFSKNCNLRALKRLFKSFGPIRSMTLVLETHQPHLCIQYEVLKAAQLALESLDGILVESTSIKHSWFTLWPRTDGNKR